MVNSAALTKKIFFLIYKEIQMGAVAKSYMRKGFLIYEEMRQYLVIYEEAVRHIWLSNRSLLDFLIYEENFVFFFISVGKWGRSGDQVARTILPQNQNQWKMSAWLGMLLEENKNKKSLNRCNN
jgi:hypothetical protein